MKADLTWPHTCRSPAGQDNQPQLPHQNDSLIQAIKVKAVMQNPCSHILPWLGWVRSLWGTGWKGQVLLVFHLLTCCSRRRLFMAVRSFWQIWQKNKPASSRLARASSLDSCWRAKARAVSCSMDGSWWVSGKEGRDDIRWKTKSCVEGEKLPHLSLAY